MLGSVLMTVECAHPGEHCQHENGHGCRCIIDSNRQITQYTIQTQVTDLNHRLINDYIQEHTQEFVSHQQARVAMAGRSSDGIEQPRCHAVPSVHEVQSFRMTCP